jgi:septal ring factor EnvC (AmiA/AmiB activator)
MLFQSLKSQFLLYSFCCIALLPVSSPSKAAAENDQQTTQQLNNIQRAIAKQTSAINQVSKQRVKLEERLKQDDLAIAKAAKVFRLTKSSLVDTKQKIAELAKTQRSLRAKKQRQEKLLAQQLRAVYATGHHDYLKLILNQDKTSHVQRTISYYTYLNAARTNEIDQFQQTLGTLLRVTTEHQEQASKLQTLQQQQKQQQFSLQNTKQLRAKTLTALGNELLSKQQQLTKLKAEELNLVEQLKKLANLVQAETNLNGLAKLKHKLSWPVKGRIQHSFGSQKQGYLKWKGVLLSAPIGRQVQTIHNGTVLFSNWLKGYGLVTVIDHGNGYMSLYGHNQTLLKSVGERVETGEAIALVGQSGGQSQSALYFEIRHRGQAINPKLWCR